MKKLAQRKTYQKNRKLKKIDKKRMVCKDKKWKSEIKKKKNTKFKHTKIIKRVKILIKSIKNNQ